MKTTMLSALCAVVLTAVASALTLDPSDPRNLGLIDPNHPADPSTSAGLINTLLDQPAPSGPVTIGANEFTRTANDPTGGVYPDATIVGMASVAAGVIASGGVVDFGGVTYLYLLAKYDGPNYGSVVWYVGGLSGATIPVNVDGQYGLSNVYLYNPTSTPPPPPPPTSVPDGGSTAILLGAALTVLGALNRRAQLATALA